MSIFGIDHAWGHPGPAALKRAGVKFVCRYLSYDPPKNLSRAEAKLLSDSGIWAVVVWETTANRALSGRAGGAADAREAAKQAAACGMPSDRPIYFAVDWDASPAQQATINAYLDGAASVIGRDRVGLYAGYGPVKRALDAGKARWGWQTYAWSGGRWDPRAHIQQYSNGHTLNGVGVDYNRAMKADYGQWRVGVTPQEDHMSPEDMAKLADMVADRVWKKDGIPAPVGSAVDTNPTWQAQSIIKDTNERTRATLAALSKFNSPDVDESAIVTGVLAGLSPAAIAQAVTDAMPPEMAKEVVDELAARLKT